MAANVETMFSVREKPWHGLGVVVEEAPSSEEALRLAGLDWRVVQKSLYTNSGLVDGYKLVSEKVVVFTGYVRLLVFDLSEHIYVMIIMCSERYTF